MMRARMWKGLEMRVFAVAVMLGLAGVSLGEVRVTTQPASQPTTQSGETLETKTRVVHPFEKLANSMPQKLWPNKDETQAVRTLRDNWLKENFQAGKLPAWNWSGTVEDVQSGQSRSQKGQTGVLLQVGDMQIWGKTVRVRVDAILVNAPADVLEWPKGKAVTVKGIFWGTSWDRGNSMTIRTVSELPPDKSQTPTPNKKPKEGAK